MATVCANGIHSAPPLVPRSWLRVVHRTHSQLLHHCPHRPRKIDPRRSVDPVVWRSVRARDGGAGARLDGHRARARHHDQGAERHALLRRARRAPLPAQLHRHARSRRLQLRSLAFAGGVRRRVARRRRRARRRSAIGGELLYGDQPGSRSDPGAEQDGSAAGRTRKGRDRDRRDHRPRCEPGAARQREDGRRHSGTAGAARREGAAAARRSRCAAAGADHRFVVRQLSRRRIAGARRARPHREGRPHRRQIGRPHAARRRRRLLQPETDRSRIARRRRSRLRRGRHQRDPRRAGRRHDRFVGASRHGAVTRLRESQTAGVRGTVSGQRRRLRGFSRCAEQADAERRVAVLRAGEFRRARVSVSAAASSACCTWKSCRSGSSASTTST